MTGITPALFMFTLIAVLLIAAGAFALHMRKRSNREPTEKPHLAGKTMAPTEGDRRS